MAPVSAELPHEGLVALGTGQLGILRLGADSLWVSSLRTQQGSPENAEHCHYGDPRVLGTQVT